MMSHISTRSGVATPQFRVGNVLTRAWGVTIRNLPKLFLATVIPYLPNLLPGSERTGGSASPGAAALLGILGLVWWIVLSPLSQAFIAYGAFQDMRGRSFNVGQALKQGFARLLPIIGLQILTSVGTFLGYLLLVVPGAILVIMWSVALPACVLERLSPLASLRRSAALTKGHRWKLFGMTLLVGVIGLILFLLFIAIVAAVGGRGPSAITAFQIGAVIWVALGSVYYYVFLVIIYHDLRVAKEGVDVDQIAAVFD